MNIEKIRLINFRCFEDITIHFDRKLTVLVAENGAGKTTILDGIAIAFGRLLTKMPKLKGVTFKDSDIRLDENNKTSPFTYYSIEIINWERTLLKWSAGKRRDTSQKTKKQLLDYLEEHDVPVGYYGEIDSMADEIIDRFNDGQVYQMPVVVYYGTNRAMTDVVQRRQNFKKEFNRIDSLSSSLNQDTRFRDLFEWFTVMEDMERRQQQQSRDFDYRLPELESVRTVIERVLPGYSNPRTEVRPIRFMIDQQINDNQKVSYRIEQLSDGYRMMLALVMDLARRMSQANPPHFEDDGKTLSDPLQTPAIVLIDEVDLHLHPSWQQRVISDLQRAFPRTQFIISTHSPQVLTTVPDQSIRIISNGTIYSAPKGSQGAETSRVLKRIFGVETRPPEDSYTQKLHEYLDLIYADQWTGERAIHLRQQLNEHFGNEEPALTAADLYIENRQWELEDEED